MTRKIDLQPQEAQSLLAVRSGTEIHCLDGILWVTQSGDLKDHILERGEKFTVHRKGTLVLQALNSASTFSMN